MRGKEKLDEAVGQRPRADERADAHASSSGPSSRIEALEREVAALKAKAKARPAAARKPAARRQGEARGPPSRPLARIAITGTASFLGGRVLRRLVEARGADAVLAVDIAAPPTTLHGVRHRMVDLTLPGADQRLVDVFQEEHVDTVVPRGLLHDPAPRRRLLARARVDRHAAPGGGGGRGRRAAPGAALLHRGLRGARAEPELPHRGPARPTPRSPLAWVRDKVEAEEHAFSFSRRYPGLGVTRPALRDAAGARGPHLLHAHLQQAGGPGGAGLRPARAAPAPRRRPRRAWTPPSRRAPAGSSTWCRAARSSLLTALHLADKLTVAVPHVVAYPVADLWWALGRGGGPGRLHRLRALPLRGRRREGAARARLRGAATRAGTR